MMMGAICSARTLAGRSSGPIAFCANIMLEYNEGSITVLPK